METLRAAHRNGSRPAVTANGASLTYTQLLAASLRVASLLKDLPGKYEGHRDDVAKGDGPRVAIFGTPGAEFVSALWAAWRNGHVAVPLATSHPPAQLLYVMQDAGVSFVTGTEAHRPLLEPLANQCGARFVATPAAHTFSHLDPPPSSEAEPLSAHGPDRGSGSASLILYTSGTTGRPKGVVHTYHGLAAQAAMLQSAWEYTPSDRMLHCLPLHHIHGLMNVLIAPHAAGAAVEFMPKFSPTAIWARWQASNHESHHSQHSDSHFPHTPPITVFSAVPTMYVRLLQAYDIMTPPQQKEASEAARRLRLMMCGSAALPEVVMRRWEKVSGHRLLERYGMTEVGMALTNPLHGERRGGCVGMAFEGEEVKVVGEGEGELRVKSPAMFREYWGKPEATANEFDSDGFFCTGDWGKIEDGYFKILGRVSVDMMKRGGHKISALEIEATLLTHPGVVEAAVFGEPDEVYGERVVAVVVGRRGVKGEEVREWMTQHVPSYQVPSLIHFLDSIPKNAMGKVNKIELKALFTA